MYGAAQQQGAYDPSMGAPPTGFAAPQGMYDPSMGQAAMMGGPQMGPPMMMGQPPMGAPGFDPQAQIAHLEEKEKALEEKRRKKDIEHRAHMARSDAREQGDNAGCARILIGWGILNFLFWVLPLLGDSWWNKIWHGEGIGKLTLGVGLFHMHVHVECAASWTGDATLCKAMSHWAGGEGSSTGTFTQDWTMQDLRDQMCNEPHSRDMCGRMDRLVYAGYSPVVMLCTAAIFEVLAVLLLCVYWKVKPMAWARNLANTCSCLAPICGIIGLMAWFVVSPHLTELPRMWAGIAGDRIFADNPLFGLQETFTIPMGWCCLLLCFNMASSSIRLFMQLGLPFHINEPDPYGNAESARLIAEIEKSYDGEQKA